MYLSIKIIDTYVSKINKNKIISEYIIYVMFDDEAIYAETLIGDQEVVSRIHKLKKEYNTEYVMYGNYRYMKKNYE